MTSSSSSQDATKFEVRIRITEKELLRPGMSVTAEIETRSRTNVLTVPFMSVTTRPPKIATNAAPNLATSLAAGGTNGVNADKKSKDSNKHVEVVFVTDGDRAKMIPVKIGISDENYYEIVEGLQEGQEVISGNYRAIKDLEDGKKIVRGTPGADTDKKAM
jgi:HlyD family secretion protein